MYWSIETEKTVGTLTLDHPDKSMNILTKDVMEELDEKLDGITGLGIDGLIVRSGKDGSFIAGADIHELQTIEDEQTAYDLARKGQSIFQKLADLPFPTIALIDGPCLGGGFELSLACDYRIISDSDNTQLGCPEVKLGIIPGWGGTQRLPRLIGLKDAIGPLLKGSSFKSREAVKKGVADKSLNSKLLEKEARKWINEDRFPDQDETGWDNRWPLREYILNKAHEKTMSRTHGNMPAPLALIRAIRGGLKRPLDEALELEAEEFGALATTPECKNLIRVFFLNESQKKFSLDEPEVSAPERTGVIGAGTMGSGIAHWVSSRDLEVAMVDIDGDAVNNGMKNIKSLYDKGIRAGAVTERKKRRGLRRIHPTTSYEPLEGAELVIEAVLEKMEVKKKVFDQLSDYVDEETVVASNTSALSITEMGAELDRPSLMVGLHFFNPVYKMDLIEVVRGEDTSDETAARAVEFVKAINKVPVVVRDKPGFLVNRVLVPYLNEAGHLLDEGHRIKVIDRALTEFGMPMGPLRLIDEVGIDVGFHVAEYLSDSLETKYPLSDSFEQIYNDGLKGKKGGEGFYRGYDSGDEQPNPQYQPDSPVSDSDSTILTRRLINLMVAEAVRCLEEEVVASADELDIAMILGTGFAPFRGGVLRHADDYGLSKIVEELEQYGKDYGPRYQVPNLLREKAENGETFTRSE